MTLLKRVLKNCEKYAKPIRHSWWFLLEAEAGKDSLSYLYPAGPWQFDHAPVSEHKSNTN